MVSRTKWAETKFSFALLCNSGSLDLLWSSGETQESTYPPSILAKPPAVLLFTASLLPNQSPLNDHSDATSLPVFTNVTQKAGLAYKITCGDEVTEYLIDVNGEGAAFFDYDNDGDMDIYLVNGSSRQSIKSGKLPHDYLLRTTAMVRSQMSRKGRTWEIQNGAAELPWVILTMTGIWTSI